MQIRTPPFFAALAIALALNSVGPAQDKSSDRPPEADKAPRRDPRPDDERPRREGDVRPEGGKSADGPEARGRFGDGKGPPPGFGGEGPRGGKRGFGGSEFGGYGGVVTGPAGAMPGGMPMPGGMRGFGMGSGGMGMYGSSEPDDPEMRDLHRKDSEMERQTMQLVAKYRSAGSEERAKLKQEVTDLVAKHFDVRQERRKLQLKRMKEELERLSDAITKRDDSSDSIVKNRIAELIGEPRELDF
jgi:hypothetical protein